MRRVPFKANFDMVKRVSYFGLGVLWLSALVQITTLIYPKIQDSVTPVLSIFAIAYFIVDIIQNYIFQQAELNRKNDFIDNSLGTNLADSNSSGYFSNDNIVAGVIKMGTNCFENSLFTKTISGKMILSQIISTLVIIFLFLGIAFWTDQKILSTILQVALPYTIVQQTVRLIVFHFKIKAVFNHFKIIFSMQDGPLKDSLIISNVINYESVLSWAGIKLSDAWFKKLDPVLALEWDSVKQKFNL